MTKFKPTYKSEYAKILDTKETDNLTTSENNKCYTFKTTVTNNNISSYKIFSNRSRNENERFENKLICR